MIKTIYLWMGGHLLAYATQAHWFFHVGFGLTALILLIFIGNVECTKDEEVRG